METVTSRISKVKQPRGGYLNPKKFTIIELDNKNVLKENENIHASLIGLVVDYLTRFLVEKNLESAF